jgi:hypothetical protein
MLTGVMLPWLLWLDHLVTAEFEGRKWDLPSRVFARPLSIYEGLPISPQTLESELGAAGYRKLAAASMAGTYAVSDHGFEIHRRPFHFDDGPREALRFRLSISAGAVSGLRDTATSASLDLVRLEPAEIASIYPLHDEDRTLVSIDQVPELLLTGLQAVEDRQFKHHPGVDLRGIARALVANLRARATVQGGSTLTQQLVKNYYLSNAQTLSRKINEALMALLLELRYGKSEILEAYINEIHLGQQGSHGIHGFGRASEFYFAQPLQQLEPHQVALLVGLVRGSSFYNPRRNPERSLQRRNLVLDVFADTGLLARAAADHWKSRPLGVIPNPGWRARRPTTGNRGRWESFRTPAPVVTATRRSSTWSAGSCGAIITRTICVTRVCGFSPPWPPRTRNWRKRPSMTGWKACGSGVCPTPCRARWCWPTWRAAKSGPWWGTGNPAGRASTGRWMRAARSVRWSSRWSTCWRWSTMRITAC